MIIPDGSNNPAGKRMNREFIYIIVRLLLWLLLPWFFCLRFWPCLYVLTIERDLGARNLSKLYFSAGKSTWCYIQYCGETRDKNFFKKLPIFPYQSGLTLIGPDSFFAKNMFSIPICQIQEGKISLFRGMVITPLT